MPARALALALALAFAVLPAPAGAVMDEPMKLPADHPLAIELKSLKAEIDAGGAARALPRLQEIVQLEPELADGWNLYGFALRKTQQLDESQKAYQRALFLDPNHIGAHEYMGELYLMRGEAAKAEELLARLAVLCPDGCEERTELAEAIAAHRAGKPIH